MPTSAIYLRRYHSQHTAWRRIIYLRAHHRHARTIPGSLAEAVSGLSVSSNHDARFLVAGCGAIGSLFGGLLRKAGHDVTLLGRGWHLDAIAAHGLSIDGIWGVHHAEGFHLARDTSELSGRYDAILVAVKAYDTAAMADDIAPYFDPQGIVASLQNGLGNIEMLAQHFGAERSLGASILIGATIREPGQVTVTVQAARVVVGPLDAVPAGSLDRAKALAGLLDQAGIPCKATDRILSFLWAKVLYNAPLNALGALLDVHYGALGDSPNLRTIMDSIIDEVFRVSEAGRISLAWSSPEEYREELYEKLVPLTYQHRSSMLQDLERGRRTEIQAINGAIWRMGAELGVPTPFNELMTRLISWREQKGRET